MGHLLGLTTIEIISHIAKKYPSLKFITLREFNAKTNPIAMTKWLEPAQGDSLEKVALHDFTSKNWSQDLAKNRILGVESCVKINGKNMHIPMMDYECKKTHKELKSLVKVWKRYIIPRFGKGVILETDNSYHFIGTEKLLSENDLINYLAWSLICVKKSETKYERSVDIHYIGYCQLKRSLCLRITPYQNTSFIPHVVYEF